jgi:N-acetylmuramoyl-L-alanine amidase
MMIVRQLILGMYGRLGAGWVAGWRRNLASYWYGWEKDQIAFFSFLLVAMALLGSFAYFAYTAQVRLDHKRQRHEDLTCLARNVYFEARGESLAGQRAVAEVTMNRVASGRFPNTVCEVVYEKRWDLRRKRYVGAFSWTELEEKSEPSGIAWQRALAAAKAVYDGREARIVPSALFYHADKIRPRWARSQNRIAKIGRHVFYE